MRKISGIYNMCAVGATMVVPIDHRNALVLGLTLYVERTRWVSMLTVRTGGAVVHSCRHGVG